MVAPLRIPAGVNNAQIGSTSSSNAIKNNHPLWNYPQLDPTRLFQSFEDFATYRTVDWTLTQIGTGTSALVAGVGGILQLTTTAASGDAVTIQHTSADHDIEASSGEQFWFSTRVKPQLASVPDYYFGMFNAAATVPASATDGVYFHCNAASANVDLVLKSASTATTIASISTMADATWGVWSFYYDGKSTLYYYKDKVLLGSTTTLTNFPAVTLAQLFHTKNGAAATNYLQVDYYMAAEELTR